MPPIMANSKDGQGDNDKYLDTSRNNAHLQYEISNIYYLEVLTNVNLKKIGQMSKGTNKKILSLGIFKRNIKALALTVQKL